MPRKYLSHIKSNQTTTSGGPKLPTASQIIVGEIAINYHKGVETISLKNDDEKVVAFSSDNTLIAYVDDQDKDLAKAAGLSANTVAGTVGVVDYSYIKDSSDTILSGATSLADADAKLSEAIEQLKDVDTELDSGSTKPVANSAITSTIIEDEEIIAGALADLNTRVSTISGTVETKANSSDVYTKEETYTKDEVDSLIPDDYLPLSGGTLTGDLTVNGTITATGAVYSSDVRLKENIKDLTNEDIEKISNIEIQKYNFKQDEDKLTTYGIIAQDVQALGLDNIVKDGINGYLGVDYIAFLVAKTKQLESGLIKVYNGEPLQPNCAYHLSAEGKDYNIELYHYKIPRFIVKYQINMVYNSGNITFPQEVRFKDEPKFVSGKLYQIKIEYDGLNYFGTIDEY